MGASAGQAAIVALGDGADGPCECVAARAAGVSLLYPRHAPAGKPGHWQREKTPIGGLAVCACASCYVGSDLGCDSERQQGLTCVTHMHRHIHIHACTHARSYAHAYIRTCMHACMHTNIQAYKHINILTHTWHPHKVSTVRVCVNALVSSRHKLIISSIIYQCRPVTRAIGLSLLP